jgi:hypothetical protein
MNKEIKKEENYAIHPFFSVVGEQSYLDLLTIERFVCNIVHFKLN